MLHYAARLRVPVPAADLFDWHARPGAFERLTPPWQPVRLEHSEGIESGARAVIRLGAGPASIRWTTEHRGTSDACRHGAAPCHFEDVQVEGPFAAWAHTHTMTPDGDRASVLDDAVAYQLPLAPLSTALGGRLSRRELDRLFAYRHRVTREDLVRHAAAGLAPMTVAVTGASGLVGRQLCAFLTTGGHRVVRLVRDRDEALRLDRSAAERAVYWDPAAGACDVDRLAEVAPDAVIHLAGEPVFGIAYTADKKRRIWESRTWGTGFLARVLAALPVRPRVLVSTSASGYYGARGEADVTEADGPGAGFLAGVCRAWEAATAEAERAGIRTVHARIGLVLTPAGGLLGTAGLPARLGLAAWPGSGRDWWPWIALDDVLYALHYLVVTDTVSGAVNLSAPRPATARETVTALAHVLHRPTVGGVPASVIRALGGEAADELALKSVRMLPQRLRASGFRWAYPDVEGALRHLYGRPAAPSP